MRFTFIALLCVVTATGVWAQSPERGAGHPQKPAGAPVVSPADQSAAAAADVLALERQIGEAIVRGDATFFDSVTSDDFVMVHGDAWTKGGKPALVDDKASFVKRVASHSYAAHDFDSVAVEMHGDVAITYGRYIGNIPGSPPGRQWFNVWYEKVYAKRQGRWMYLSHRTVNGAHYGMDRQAVTAK